MPNSKPFGNQTSTNANEVAEFQLADGGVVHFRHVQPEDEPLIAEAISTSSPETLLHRFFSPIRRVSSDRLRAMLTIDRKKETCIVGVVTEKEAAGLFAAHDTFAWRKRTLPKSL